MTIRHSGTRVPVMDSILHTGNKEWVLFVWDDFLHPSQEVEDSQFYVSDGLLSIARSPVVTFNYRGRVYTRCYAILVDTVDNGSTLTADDPHVEHYINHKLILAGGFEIERTVKLLSGII